MSNASIVDRLAPAVDAARSASARFADLHPLFNGSVESLEGLPWPVLQRGRDLAAELWRQSLCDEEVVEFDMSEERTQLIDEIEKWLTAVRLAG